MTKTEVKPKPPLTCFFLQKAKSRKERMQKIHRVEKEEPRSLGQNTEGKCDGGRTGRKSYMYILFMSYDIIMVWTLIISGMSIQAQHHTCVATRICSKRSISNIKLTFLWQMGKRYRPQELAIFFSSAQNMMGLITWSSYVMCSMYLSYVEI